MTRKVRDAARETFDRVCSAAALTKRAGAWYWQGEDAVVVLELQRSQYSLSYF